MYRIDGHLILSPTDLVGFLACEHLTQLDLMVSRGLLVRPSREDPALDMRAAKGRAHEAAVLDQLRSERASVVEILDQGSSIDALAGAEAATLAAMRSGVEVIYQAAFFDGTWRGQADFLLRVDTASALGPWSYEVADAKLAWTIRTAARVQLSDYSLQVARLQGVEPALMHAFLGNGTVEGVRVAEYAQSHLADRRRFEEVALGAPRATAPEPVGRCGVCPWIGRCTAQWQAGDHLSLVRGMRSTTARRLVAAGVSTGASLAATVEGPSADIDDATWRRLRDQARLQIRAAEAGSPLYELVPLDATGLVDLPEPAAGDLFFDMESQPFMVDGPREYLFGFTAVVDGAPQYRALWGHTPAEERRGYEALVDLVIDRLRSDPWLHVFHYASYEVNALRRLAARHGSRRSEVERLIAGGVLVDLHVVARSSVVVSLPSYSLKSLEAYYMPAREDAVSTGGGSMVAYERWRETGDPALLEAIRVYNERDCLSTMLLRTWLEERRAELGRLSAQAVPRPTSPVAAAIGPDRTGTGRGPL